MSLVYSKSRHHIDGQKNHGIDTLPKKVFFQPFFNYEIPCKLPHSTYKQIYQPNKLKK